MARHPSLERRILAPAVAAVPEEAHGRETSLFERDGRLELGTAYST